MTALIRFILALVASALPGIATASAQQCEMRPLAFDTYQGGELEPTDCLFPAESCNDCVSYAGEVLDHRRERR